MIQRVLAIPPKRFERRLVSFLTDTEVVALLSAPDRTTWVGRRDHTLFATAVQTGLRASELIGSRTSDVHLGVGPHISCLGKGRKQRITPLTTSVVALLRTWLCECRDQVSDLVFTTLTGRMLSRDALEHRLADCVAKASNKCPSLRGKRITLHVLRHTAAMRLLLPESTSQSSPCGSVMSRLKPPRSIFMRTSLSKKRHSRGPHP